MKRFLLKLLIICMMVSCVIKTDVKADDMIYRVVNTSNNEVLGSYDSYSSALSNLTAMKKNNGSISYGIEKNNKLIQCDNAVARLSGYFTYKEADSGREGYATGASAADAAYISTSSDGNTIRIKLSGQIMDIPESALLTLENPNETTIKSYYTNSNGYMMHYIYSYSNGSTSVNGIRVGMKYNYFADNTKYYSYDGHYFYSNYNTMLSDYRSNIISHAVNAGNPYYNYFQYLPHRALTSVTSSQIDNYVVSKIGSSANSVMYNTGSNFIDEGKKYTINGLLMFGLALYESGYGRSNYALNNNNLFGHGAYDHTASATVYSSVDECIAYHAYNFLSNGYLNAGDSRYRGSHVGDKQSGINVKYASTPYWGENVASIGYYLGNDYGKYTIGVVSGDVRIYNSPSTSATTLYSTGATGSSNDVKNVPVIILDTVSGSDGKSYYKIMCDTALNETRTKISPDSIYDSNRDYGYILASAVTKINTGSVTITPPVVDPETPTNPTNYNPQGVVDSVTSNEAGKVRVSGWAFDKDSSSTSINVNVYVGSNKIGTLTANQTRNDVNEVYGITGNHGYSGTLSTKLYGNQAVTVKAVDLYTNNEVTIGSKVISIEKAYTTNYNPQGCIDVLGSGETGKLSISGWAFDKDDVSESISIKIYADQQIISTISANQTRDDVNKVYGITGLHGFSTKVSLTPGNHLISIYMIDLGTNKEVLLESETIKVEGNAIEQFNDVDENQWYKEYIQFVVDKGYMSGYSSSKRFGPEDKVTREMMVQVLYNMAGKPKVTDHSATALFWDVYEGAWFEEAVCWAYNNGITTGMDGGFGTGKNMTREQMVRFLRNYAKEAGLDVSATASINSYPDYKEVDDWAKEDMSWGVATGMISGVTLNNVNYLQPLGNATRAQLATVLTRYCNYYKI